MAELDLTNIAGSSIATPAAGVIALYSETTTKLLSYKNDAGTIRTIANQMPISGALVAAPGGITNTSGLMLGLSNLAAGNIITPATTGRVLITISGVVAGNTTADGAFWHIRVGTGVAPSNAGALVGSQIGGQQSMSFLTGVLKVPFSITSLVTGATLNTALWIDLVLGTVTGGTATMTQVTVAAIEI